MTPRRTSTTRRAVKRTIIPVALLFIVFNIVVPQWLQQQESFERLRQVNPVLVLLALGLQAGALVAYAVLTRVTLPDEPRLSLWTVFRIQLSTRAVTNVVPGGSAAGGTLGYRLFTETGVPSSSAGFTMATVGLGSAVVLNLMLWLALLISIPFAGLAPGYVTAAIVGALLLSLAAALIFLLLQGREQAERVIRAIARRIPYVNEDTASRFIHQVADRLYDLSQQPDLVRKGILWAAINWLLDAATLWTLLFAFGYTMNPVYLFVAYGLAGVLAAIPITPGGLGLVEGAIPAALVGFGAPGAEATAAVFSWRFAQFWMPIPLGGLAYLSLRLGLLRRLEGERTADPQPAATGSETTGLFGRMTSVGEAAEVRVWDSATGEYRTARQAAAPEIEASPSGQETSSPGGQEAPPSEPPDEDTAAVPFEAEVVEDEDPDQTGEPAPGA